MLRKIVLVLVAVAAVALEVDGQMTAQRSDSLFALGVDLYNAEKYEEAIPLFAESDKIDKAVLDSTSNRRDYSSWWLASCYYQLGDSANYIRTSLTTSSAQ